MGVGYQVEARDRLAEIGHGRGVRDISNPAIGRHERTGVGRQGRIIHRERLGRRPPKAVIPLLQPVQRDRRQPARFAGERRQALGTPVGVAGGLVLRILGRGNVQNHRRG